MDKTNAAVTLFDALGALGPWFGAGGATAIIVAYLGTRKPSGDAQRNAEAPQHRWYFDGPVVKIIDLLEGIYRELKAGRVDLGEAERNARDRHRDHMEVLRDISDRLPRRR